MTATTPTRPVETPAATLDFDLRAGCWRCWSTAPLNERRLCAGCRAVVESEALALEDERVFDLIFS